MITELEYRALEAGIPWSPAASAPAWLTGSGPAYPEATERLLVWSEDRMLEYRPGRCLGWVLAGWQHVCGPACFQVPSRWLDHVSTWEVVPDGRERVLVSNPYEVTPEDVIELQALEGIGARVSVLQPSESWYGYNTYQLEIWVTS